MYVVRNSKQNFWSPLPVAKTNLSIPYSKFARWMKLKENLLGVFIPSALYIYALGGNLWEICVFFILIFF